MTYLVDTNILSDIRRRFKQPNSWLETVIKNSVFISVITLGEIERGIVLIKRRDATAASILETWFQNIKSEYAQSILPVSENVALEWGRISALRTRNIADALIAATAIVHNLTLVTRNVADFSDLPIKLINP